jgi:sialate O-acetylesterase
VGYYFANEWRRYLDVPVGLIGCNWGGTPACTWMDETHILKGGGEVFLREYQEALDKLDKEAYEAAFRANPASYHTDLLADPISDLMLFGATMEELGAKLMEMGIDPQAMANYQPVIGPKYERRPCGLYESMLKPLSPYGLRGFLYYQGETDGDNHPECYKTLFPQLIENWRDLWKEGIPFYFVQIAPLEQWMQCVGKPYAMIREAQQHTADTVPLTGMASTSDVGMQWDIHPKKKRPVGERLAYLALHQVYGLDLVCEAPRLIGAERKKDKLILHFAGAESGLELRSMLPDGLSADPERLNALVIRSQETEIPGETMKAKVEGSDVVLDGVTLPEDGPLILCFARSGWYAVNLYNKAGIPAVPAEIVVEE